MKKAILILTLISSSAFAVPTRVSNSCVEKASYKIIDQLEKDEPKADVHLIKDDSDRVIGLTDSEDYYGSYELTDVIINGTKATVIFHDNDAIIFATINLGKKMKSCQIVNVDMGQDDHD